MPLKSNRAFTLLEVLITVAILTTGIVFLFRSFAASLSAARFSQHISLACYLAEGKIWELEQKQLFSVRPIGSASGEEESAEKIFSWNYNTSELEGVGLAKLKFVVSWEERLRKEKYNIEFFTYLQPKK